MTNKMNNNMSMNSMKRKINKNENGGNNKRRRITMITNDYVRKSDFNEAYVSLQFKMKNLELKSVQIPEYVKNHVEEEIKKFKHCKVQFGFHAEFEKDGDEEEIKEWSWSYKATEYSDDFMDKISEKANVEISVYSELSSGWKIKRILELRFILTKYVPVIYLSGRSYIQSPTALHRSNAIVNVHNTDNKCFIYSILAVLKYDIVKDHRDRPQKYNSFLNEFTYDEQLMPMKLINIPEFERQNNLSITVFKYNETVDKEENEILYKNPYVDIIFRTKNPNGRPIILLVLENDLEFHYTAVVNLDRLLNLYDRTINFRIQRKWCIKCLHGFKTQSTFDRHVALCTSNTEKTTLYTMPKEKELKFKDYGKTITPAFVIYADIEAVLIPEENSSLVKHMPIAVGLLLMPLLDTTIKSKYYSFSGTNCMVKFLQCVDELSKNVVAPWYKKNMYAEMNLTTSDQEAFTKSTQCYMCGNNKNNLVRDHDHYTGKYLGAACNQCNLSRKVRMELPVVFHNFKGYDSHHIIKYALNQFPRWDLKPISQTTEKFLALFAHVGNHITVRFIDSFQFLSSSLSTLTKTLERCPITATEFPHGQQSKGIFPYKFATSYEMLINQTKLPEQWSEITSGEYEIAKSAWIESRSNNLLEYMMYYMKLDIYLLADVFQTFRKKALEEHGLEPLRFVSLPGLSWSSALKSMDRPIELLQDAEMHRLFELGIRGGMTFVNKHYVQANENTSLLYIDINNLYGWALTQHLPYKDFEFIPEDQIEEKYQKMFTDKNNDIGYLLEIDLEIPIEHHDRLDQLPLAPEHKCPPGSKVKKLLMTHEPKRHYIVYWRLLELYIKLGARVTAVHRIIQFKQTEIFADYINANSTRRAESKSKFEKDFYKLLNNALYGKTVENLKNRMDLRLCNNEKKFVTYTSKVTFKKTMDIAEGLKAVLLEKDTICLDRPSYIGQVVLDLSKLRMYRLQYEELEKYRQQFHCKIDIIAGDTDSFFLSCTGVDKNQLLSQMKLDGLLDTSNYPKDHSLYSNNVANRIGLFKDEGEGEDYTEWVFLRPKCYSLKKKDASTTMKAKGVSLKQTDINHRNYLNAYNKNGEEEEEPNKVKQTSFQSINHQVYTIESMKSVLSCLDDKRFWSKRNNSRAYGHHKINNKEEEDDELMII